LIDAVPPPTPHAITTPPAYEQRVLTQPAPNQTQPTGGVTPLRFIEEAPPGSLNQAPTQPSAVPVPAAQEPETSAPTTPGPPAPAPAASGATNVGGEVLPSVPVATVYFGVASAVLDARGRGMLTGLDRSRCYSVVGHADPTGRPQDVLGLSLSRAAAVAMVLRAEGLTADVTGVGSYGSSGRPEDYPHDRRVEVWAKPCGPASTAPVKEAQSQPKPEAQDENPPPGGISTRIFQIPDGTWMVIVSRRFVSETQARRWEATLRGTDPMKAEEPTGLPRGTARVSSSTRFVRQVDRVIGERLRFMVQSWTEQWNAWARATVTQAGVLPHLSLDQLWRPEAR
jgi:outer membrane protein OmpA-like peptidoglycan-associated protein